jgi:hypothetical protein
VRVSLKLSFDNPESFKEATESLRFNNPPSDPNSLEPMESSIPRQERSEDSICLDDPPSDPNTLQRMPSREIIEIT